MSPKLIYPLFFLSGATGLIYEIVWGRLFVYIFGSTTNSTVAVVSAFLGGLALGSLFFGTIADRLSAKKLLETYSNLELGIGATGILSLFLIKAIRLVYANFSDGSNVSWSLLFIKFLLATMVILISTILMGATLPIVVRFVAMQNKNLGRTVSLLYALNTFGAVLGVLLAAFLLIELFGLTTTLLTAVLLNFLLGFSARLILLKEPKQAKKMPVGKFWSSQVLNKRRLFVILTFTLSGFISIAYEILWIRILTPTIGTFVYSFAVVLTLYLLGLVLGSFSFTIFKRLVKSKVFLFGLVEFAIGFFALLSVWFTSSFLVIDKNLLVLLVILPATFFMGLSFPAVVDLLESRESGKIVGLSYFGNTLGSIFGGYMAGFVFIPLFGSTQSILLLSLGNFLIAFFFFREEKIFRLKFVFSTTVLIIALFSLWLFLFKKQSLFANTTQWWINWAKERQVLFIFKEDEVASVFAYHNPKNDDSNLFIDGVPTTHKSGETELMAHIPVLLHPNPKKVLVIALGMGTTFKTSLDYGLETDVVELVPTVPQVISLFHPDIENLQRKVKNRIIINDGRNYVFLTKQTYDIVTIDPPPPFNAAGTTVLYSEDFYRDIAKKINRGGIVSQWIWFGSSEDYLKMATKSFLNVFPYVYGFKMPNGLGGIFLEGSFEPIVIEKTEIQQRVSRFQGQEQISRFYSGFQLKDIADFSFADRERLAKWTADVSSISDDQPRSEYFFLKHLFKKGRNLEGLAAEEIVP